MQEQNATEAVIQAAPPATLEELGERIRLARESHSWAIEEAAQKLHLPVATVSDLEAGRSQRIGTPIYLKGFLRSYLKLLKLPELWAEQAMGGSAANAAQPVILPAAGAVARRVSWLERYKWAASYVVGTALALTAVHWLVSNTPQLGFPEAQRSNVPAASPTAPAAATTETHALAVPQVESLGPVQSAPAAVSSSPLDESPVMASLTPFGRGASEAVNAADEPAGLLLSFDQDSWVEVRDAAGAPLLYAVVRAGEKRTFSEGAPFSVRIGNVLGVRASVSGAELDLGSFTRGNVARFEVARRAGVWQAVPRSSDPAGAPRDGG